ncbi:glycosyl hydrolase family 76-domain-containing protein [Camillea tinctor]|nr:glycosyl hydrolase family 76-domain-containing protein [Camillea tinctor]
MPRRKDGNTQLFQECPIFSASPRHCDPLAPKSFLPTKVQAVVTKGNGASSRPDRDVFDDLLDAMDVMQSEFFAPWLGTWPTAIDWTAAVMGTHISGATRSLSEGLMFLDPADGRIVDWKSSANVIDNYFSQLVGFYFGQDAFAIRNQAYDDILWVVLGWLETIRFVDTHDELYYEFTDEKPMVTSTMPYYGNLWTPAFSHRARVFWDLALAGWDETLCSGGMIWNPRLLPYKNAITNELFIAASISMYQYFPGDNNTSPFSGTRDAKYLKAAVEGYRWLINANMTNEQGLYTDGYHISGYADSGNNNTKCDERNDMVFTYNQGVLLTGLRGLWDATGALSFLSDGHKLIQNVINATGYDLALDTPFDDLADFDTGALPPWYGLGRLGVMEDTCDASGTCSQDGQTFKGIFFHHLAAFCEPFFEPAPGSGVDIDHRAFAATKKSHDEACSSYGGWLAHNVEAAMGTLDSDGKFGMWWTAGLLTSNWTGPWPTKAHDGVPRNENSTDYRNYGVPHDEIWRRPHGSDGAKGDHPVILPPSLQPESVQKPLAGTEKQSLPDELRKRYITESDPNTRGRGRTVETQGGGLALLRAYWKIAQSP